MTVEQHAAALKRRGFVAPDETFSTARASMAAADAIVRVVGHDGGLPPHQVIGEFVIPPPDGPPSREFQTLHFDFGLPLVPMLAGDVGHYTALHVRCDVAAATACTRLVDLGRLLAQRSWPETSELLRRFRAYGASHGAWDARQGYAEGSLARLIEAASGLRPSLPSVSADPSFLCGLEFQSLEQEEAFLAWHGLDLSTAATDVRLRPADCSSLTTWPWPTAEAESARLASWRSGFTVRQTSAQRTSCGRGSVC